eukprot:jgi/Chlat1/2667/Chrsp18S02982
MGGGGGGGDGGGGIGRQLRAAAAITAAVIVGVVLLGVIGADAASEKLLRKEDVPFIKCGVCETLVRNTARQVKAWRDSGRKVKEIDVIELVEKSCDPTKDEGEWITKIDLVEQGDVLALEEQDSAGECKSECKTIARACEEVLGNEDVDYAEVLHRGEHGRAQLTDLLCRRLSDACKHKPPPLPADRVPGPAFQPISAEDLERNRMLAKMKSMPGMGKSEMYRKEDLMRKLAVASAEDDDDEEEDDDDDGNKGFTPPSDEGLAPDQVKAALKLRKKLEKQLGRSLATEEELAEQAKRKQQQEVTPSRADPLAVWKAKGRQLLQQAREVADLAQEKAAGAAQSITAWWAEFTKKQQASADTSQQKAEL